ncbi:hypothetical protein LY78DRAFT_120956 [Colletotrichum sublineola]|nr:hypothetical protein LY78DRAFT_120956 [Colletotrichum sublineola]
MSTRRPGPEHPSGLMIYSACELIRREKSAFHALPPPPRSLQVDQWAPDTIEEKSRRYCAFEPFKITRSIPH